MTMFRGIVKESTKNFEDHERGYQAGREAAFSGRYAGNRFGPPKYNGAFGEGFAEGFFRVVR
jgi:hypothetical protein